MTCADPTEGGIGSEAVKLELNDEFEPEEAETKEVGDAEIA